MRLQDYSERVIRRFSMGQELAQSRLDHKNPVVASVHQSDVHGDAHLRSEIRRLDHFVDPGHDLPGRSSRRGATEYKQKHQSAVNHFGDEFF